VTANVQCNSVLETDVQGGNSVESNLVVEERAELRRAFGDPRRGVQFYVHGAAPGEQHDSLVGLIRLNELRERAFGIMLEPSVRRRLPAARRAARNRNAQTETLEHA
jgi:hypothetical protein